MFKFLRAFANWWAAPAPLRTLVVNKGTGDEKVLAHISVTVNSADIRIEVHNGRKHLVLPSYTLPDDVIMNGGLYTHAEIEASYRTLEDTFAPLAHPVIDGQFVPAGRPDAINAHHIGAFNRNVERRGDRIYVEKWVDIAYAQNSEGGRALLERVGFDAETETLTGNRGPVHTSTGIFLYQDFAANGDGYQWTARKMLMDHDAILLNEQGAATPAQGVGLMVNSRIEEATKLKANAVLAELSYGNLQRMLSEAASKRWGVGEQWAWVEDFDNTKAIIRTEAGSVAVTYSVKGGAVEWGGTEEPVEQKTAWIDKNPTVNRLLQLLGIRVNSDPEHLPPVEDAPDMDRKELDEALAANRKIQDDALKALLSPIGERLTALETNSQALTATLAANAKQAESGKREKVAAVIGTEAADMLTGNALDAAYAKLVGSAPVVPGFAGNNDGGYKSAELPE